MTDKILSIIVPSYNMEAYLPKCLGSLIIEDKELLQKLDVIVVNDGSKDRTSEIAHEFEAKYPGVFKVIDKSNGNYGSCVNAGLSVAIGAFVKILDADDSFGKVGFNMLLDILVASEKAGEKIDLFMTPYVRVDSKDEIIEHITYRLDEKTVLGVRDILPIAKKVAMHAIAYRRESLINSGYHQTEGISYTDTEWCFMPMTNVERIKYCSQYVYKYFVGRDGQTVSKSSTIRNFWMYQKLLTGMVGAFISGNFNPAVKEYLELRLVALSEYLYRTIISIVPMPQALEEFKTIEETVRNVPKVYVEMGQLAFSRIFRWHYIQILRNKSGNKEIYLKVLKGFLKIKELICNLKKFR